MDICNHALSLKDPLRDICFLFTGKPFDTTQPVNYAVSNIISSIVYGSRFEYTDPQFRKMVDRANENVRVGGSISMLVSIPEVMIKFPVVCP